jgi:hypothetical protein
MLSTTHRGRTPLRVEPLEARDNPAGSVSVFVAADGLLHVVGDAAGDQIMIQQDAGGAIVVTGQNGTKVNGQDNGSAAAAAAGVVVQLGDGDDVVQLSGVSVGSLTVETAGGNDQIALSGVSVTNDAAISAGAGNDVVTLYGVSVGNNLTLDGGAGTDRLAGRYPQVGGISYETGFETR